jgi:hypothetical protein
MTDEQFIDKAEKYCHAFKKLHGMFPEKIGVNHERKTLLSRYVTLWALNNPGIIDVEMTMQCETVDLEMYVGIAWDDMVFYSEKTGEVTMKALESKV